MSAITTQKMTVAEYLEWGQRPENADRRTELVDGEVIEVPPAGRWHGVICILVGGLLQDYLRQRGIGFLTSNDSGLVVAADSVRGPDLAAFTCKLTRDDRHGYGSTKPALCVEVISPTDRPGQLMKRARQYHAAGVPLVWLVDPDEQAVHVHRKGQPVELLEGDAELTAEVELPGFTCRVSALFPTLEENAP
jgi:Uma2 family endonuclease